MTYLHMPAERKRKKNQPAHSSRENRHVDKSAAPKLLDEDSLFSLLAVSASDPLVLILDGVTDP
ncbi:MAG: hypothetical protein V3T31_06255, partial [candidate division Zixibacteria bacterium]